MSGVDLAITLVFGVPIVLLGVLARGHIRAAERTADRAYLLRMQDRRR